MRLLGRGAPSGPVRLAVAHQRAADSLVRRARATLATATVLEHSGHASAEARHAAQAAERAVLACEEAARAAGGALAADERAVAEHLYSGSRREVRAAPADRPEHRRRRRRQEEE